MFRLSLVIAAVLALATLTSAQPIGRDPSGGQFSAPGAATSSADQSVPASISIQDVVRIQGQGRFTLRGLGIVVGLNGTGDSGAELALARPLAQVYANNGNPLPELKELAKGNTAALVWVDCDIPETGALIDDRFDVHVSAMHSAKSLEGGRLIIAPLMGPLVGSKPYAMAWGSITIEGSASPRTGVIRSGAQMIQNTLRNPITDSLTLIVTPEARGWTTTGTIANQINGAAGRLDDETAGPQIARAIDETTIHIVIPDQERADPANFISRIMTMRLSPTLLALPAEVLVNERVGLITVTGDVEISPVVVAHKDMVVTTLTPPLQPTAQNPLVERDAWVSMATSGRPVERARLDDLLRIFRTLDVPVKDQIHIINQIHASGRLHAKLRAQ
ncbi:MAG: flagellar basal body P-ring protein FlgI [Phycisphaeraceae bacterium]|nr:flagellar basal body P-ring protein FlgI [Phycisphaeraceae bacterium]